MSSVIGDVLDAASELAQIATDHAIQAIRDRASLPEGIPGECEYCGEMSPRLICYHCARCRDKLKLP